MYLTIEYTGGMEDLAKEYLEFVDDMVEMHGSANHPDEYLPVVEDELEYWIECEVAKEKRSAFWEAVRTAEVG